MAEGWVKAYREWLDDPVIWKDKDHAVVWLYLQLTATHAERRVDFGGKFITLRAGQMVTGRKAISQHTGVEEHKVDRIIKRFKTEQLIEQQTCSKGSLITLLNWQSDGEDEQPNEQPVSNKRATSEQQVSTNKNVKNVKNVRKNIKARPPKHQHGEYNNVLLTDEELEKLKQEFPTDYQERIDNLSGYIGSTGRTYQSHYVTIRNWDKREKQKRGKESEKQRIDREQRESYRDEFNLLS